MSHLPDPKHYAPLRRLALCTGELDIADLKGVEWWGQYISPTSGLKMHIDQDQKHVAEFNGRHRNVQEGHMLSPLISTVHYLDNTQAATLVLDQQYAWSQAAGASGLWTKAPLVPTTVTLVYPRPGRATIFDGKLLHTVVGEGKLRGPHTKPIELNECNRWRKEDGYGCEHCVRMGCGWCRQSERCVLDQPYNGCKNSYDAVGAINGQ